MCLREYRIYGERMTNTVYLFACLSFADWELPLAVSMISDTNRNFPKNRSYRVVTFGLSKEPVMSLGGMRVLPDTDVASVDLADAAMVILPGSSFYETKDPGGAGLPGRRVRTAADPGGSDLWGDAVSRAARLS